MGVSEGDCIQRMYILDAAGRQYRLIKIAKKNGSCKGKTTRCKSGCRATESAQFRTQALGGKEDENFFQPNPLKDKYSIGFVS